MRRPPRIPSPGFQDKISAKKDLYATRFVPRESQTVPPSRGGMAKPPGEA